MAADVRDVRQPAVYGDEGLRLENEIISWKIPESADDPARRSDSVKS